MSAVMSSLLLHFFSTPVFYSVFGLLGLHFLSSLSLSVFNVLSVSSSPPASVNPLLCRSNLSSSPWEPCTHPSHSLSAFSFFAHCSPFSSPLLHLFSSLSQMGVCILPCRRWEVTPAQSGVRLAPRNSWRRRTFGCWVSRRKGVMQKLYRFRLMNIEMVGGTL